MIPFKKQSKSSNQGIALLIVLTSVIILSFVIFGFITFTKTHLDEKVDHILEFRARFMAESGMALGTHPFMTPGDASLSQKFENDTGFSVRITREEGRFPINKIATDESYEQALRYLFQIWGLLPDEINIVADSLIDWVDEDPFPRTHGAESELYDNYGFKNFPQDGAFKDIDHLLLVNGMNNVDLTKPNWREYFTIHGNGKVDVNAASSEVLQAVLGFAESQAEQVIEARSGADGLPDTIDDVLFKNFDEFASSAGLDSADITSKANLISVEPNLLRIESTGFVGNFKRQLIWIVKKASNGGYTPIAKYER